MGCCFSTPNTKQPQKGQNVPKHQQQPHLGSHEQNCTIPQPIEEETVKEVLSETPISKPQQVPILTPQTKTQLPVVQNPKVPVKKAFSTTTTVTENREDEATSKRSKGIRNRKRSCAVDGNRIGARERRTQSPARKPEIPARPRPVRRREPDHPHRHSGGAPVRRSRPLSCADRSQLRPTGRGGRRVPAAKGVTQENDGVSVQESLENPHVSLECFIFL
uniref:Uncharacterized protein n=1 Tax=Cajanus cajan TaxID=3821 RepID=A0A151QZZ4_CAJCA|nr:hypothetical protein KK1_043120 [Cajanus cajan]